MGMWVARKASNCSWPSDWNVFFGAAIAPTLQNEFAYIYLKCQFTVGTAESFLGYSGVYAKNRRRFSTLLMAKTSLEVSIVSSLECHA